MEGKLSLSRDILETLIKENPNEEVKKFLLNSKLQELIAGVQEADMVRVQESYQDFGYILGLCGVENSSVERTQVEAGVDGLAPAEKSITAKIDGLAVASVGQTEAIVSVPAESTVPEQMVTQAESMPAGQAGYNEVLPQASPMPEYHYTQPMAGAPYQGGPSAWPGYNQ